jgi:hypothetical protein
MGAQEVPEHELISPERALLLANAQVMGSPVRRPFREDEPVSDTAIPPPFVTGVLERTDQLERREKRVNREHHVDDRLGWHARNGTAANMLDSQPGFVESISHRPSFLFE